MLEEETERAPCAHDNFSVWFPSYVYFFSVPFIVVVYRSSRKFGPSTVGVSVTLLAAQSRGYSKLQYYTLMRRLKFCVSSNLQELAMRREEDRRRMGKIKKKTRTDQHR